MATPDYDHYQIADESYHADDEYGGLCPLFVLRHITPASTNYGCDVKPINDNTTTDILRLITEHDANCPLGKTNPSKDSNEGT